MAIITGEHWKDSKKGTQKRKKKQFISHVEWIYARFREERRGKHFFLFLVQQARRLYSAEEFPYSWALNSVEELRPIYLSKRIKSKKWLKAFNAVGNRAWKLKRLSAWKTFQTSFLRCRVQGCDTRRVPPVFNLLALTLVILFPPILKRSLGQSIKVKRTELL